MNPQRLSWWCGPAAAANALECLGVKKDQEEIASLCHVTRKHGTNEDELIRALLACGASVDPWSSRHQRRSMRWLEQTVMNTGPTILCVDHDAHWVTVIGGLGPGQFWVYDPAAGMGLLLYGAYDLAQRWRCGKHRGGPSYYGIGVSV